MRSFDWRYQLTIRRLSSAPCEKLVSRGSEGVDIARWSSQDVSPHWHNAIYNGRPQRCEVRAFSEEAGAVLEVRLSFGHDSRSGAFGQHMPYAPSHAGSLRTWGSLCEKSRGAVLAARCLA